MFISPLSFAIYHLGLSCLKLVTRVFVDFSNDESHEYSKNALFITLGILCLGSIFQIFYILIKKQSLIKNYLIIVFLAQEAVEIISKNNHFSVWNSIIFLLHYLQKNEVTGLTQNFRKSVYLLLTLYCIIIENIKIYLFANEQNIWDLKLDFSINSLVFGLIMTKIALFKDQTSYIGTTFQIRLKHITEVKIESKSQKRLSEFDSKKVENLEQNQLQFEMNLFEVIQLCPDSVLILNNFEMVLKNQQFNKIFGENNDESNLNILFSLNVPQKEIEKYRVSYEVQKSPMARSNGSQLNQSSITQTIENPNQPQNQKLFDEEVQLIRFDQFLKQLIQNLSEITTTNENISRSQSAMTSLEGTLKKKDQKPKYFRVQIMVKVTQREFLQNKPDSLIWIFLEDQTHEIELIKTHENREFQQRMLNSFTHELRTPLNYSLNMLQNSINSSVVSDYVQNIYLLPIKNSNTILSHIINDFIDFAEIENHTLAPNKTRFNIIEELKECIELFKISKEIKHISLTIEGNLENHNAWVNNDVYRLQQIIISLISNSIQFTQKGSIQLQLEQKSNKVILISIQDTGIGMSDETIKMIKFSPNNFERPDFSNNLNIQSKGIGFGLIMVQKLVQILGDQQGIRIRSELGQGSEISFFILKDLDLPGNIEENLDISQGNQIDNKFDRVNRIGRNKQLSRQSFVKHSTKFQTTIPMRSSMYEKGENFEEMDIEEFQQQNQILTLIPKFNELSSKQSECQISFETRVLIVDDNEFNLEALKFTLKELGIESDISFSGQSAIQLIGDNAENGHHYDLIFMDLDMPELDGFQTSKMILELYNDQFTDEKPPVLITCSAFSDLNSRNQAKDSGMMDFITKPINQEHLRKILDIYLTKSYEDEFMYEI